MKDRVHDERIETKDRVHDELLQVFMATQRIAGLPFQYWSSDLKNEYWLIDLRSAEVNPTYNVTKSGIMLQISKNGLPDCLWTPWGEYNPWGDGKTNELFLGSFLGRLSLEECPLASPGKLYKVDRILGEKSLPPAILMNSPGYRSREELKEEWRSFAR